MAGGKPFGPRRAPCSPTSSLSWPLAAPCFTTSGSVAARCRSGKRRRIIFPKSSRGRNDARKTVPISYSGVVRVVFWPHRHLAASGVHKGCWGQSSRSEEHTSELQSLMRISYAVFCLKKKKQTITTSGVTRLTRDDKDK